MTNDTRQIISYMDIRCMTYFSSGQGARMRNAIEALPCYDLSGRRISVPSTSSVSSVLPKGVYIRDGKKVVVK